MSVEVNGALNNLGNEGRRADDGPDYRVFWVNPDMSIGWVCVTAEGPYEACQKTDNALGRRGVIGCNNFNRGEINIPDLR